MKKSIKKSPDYPRLVVGIVMDIIGFFSYSIPFLGELSDVFWAPISALVFYILYNDGIGKKGAIFNFLEEIIILTDFIPTFTGMWLYKNFFEK